MKIITIVGARPQFIKASVLSKAIKMHQGIEEIIIHTGQHFDANMSDVFFDELAIPKPKYNLGVNSLTHSTMTGLMMSKIEPILLHEKPDLVIVYGDTDSTLAGALAAKQNQISLAHIEAGLRSFNTSMPEETNRVIVDRISSLLFCPTERAHENLLQEGFGQFKCKIFNYGDVMKDAALFFGNKALQKSTLTKELGLSNFVLATIHRVENIDNVHHLTQIISALNEINKSTRVVVPVHPRTLQAINELKVKPTFTCIPPLGYFDMLALIQKARLVITDSGGLQKEAYFYGKYCITLRDETEWIELVSAGFNKLCGFNSNKIIETFNELHLKKMDHQEHFYGNGNAALLIVDEIVNQYNANQLSNNSR